MAWVAGVAAEKQEAAQTVSISEEEREQAIRKGYIGRITKVQPTTVTQEAPSYYDVKSGRYIGYVPPATRAKFPERYVPTTEQRAKEARPATPAPERDIVITKPSAPPERDILITKSVQIMPRATYRGEGIPSIEQREVSIVQRTLEEQRRVQKVPYSQKYKIWEHEAKKVTYKISGASSQFLMTKEELEGYQEKKRKLLGAEYVKKYGKELEKYERGSEFSLGTFQAVHKSFREKPVKIALTAGAFLAAPAILTPILATSPVVAGIVKVGVPTLWAGSVAYRVGVAEAGYPRGEVVGTIAAEEVIPFLAAKGISKGYTWSKKRIASWKELQTQFQPEGVPKRDVVKDLSKQYLREKYVSERAEFQEHAIEMRRLVRGARYGLEGQLGGFETELTIKNGRIVGTRIVPKKTGKFVFKDTGEYVRWEKPPKPPARIKKIGIDQIIGKPTAPPTVPAPRKFKPVGISDTVQSLMGLEQAAVKPAAPYTIVKLAYKAPTVKPTPSKISSLILPTFLKQKQVTVQRQEQVQQQAALQMPSLAQVTRQRQEQKQVQEQRQVQAALQMPSLAQVTRQRQVTVQKQRQVQQQAALQMPSLAPTTVQRQQQVQSFFQAPKQFYEQQLEVPPKKPTYLMFPSFEPARYKKKKVKRATWYGERYTPIATAKQFKRLITG